MYRWEVPVEDTGEGGAVDERVLDAHGIGHPASVPRFPIVDYLADAAGKVPPQPVGFAQVYESGTGANSRPAFSPMEPAGLEPAASSVPRSRSPI